VEFVRYLKDIRKKFVASLVEFERNSKEINIHKKFVRSS